MGLIDTYKKQGGINLIKQYIHSGTLFTALGELIILGKNKKALEILRLSTQYKTKLKLEKKYRKRLKEIEERYDNNLEHKTSNIVWICWFQGMDNAPQVVQRCFRSVKENLHNKKIVLITDNNLKQYVHFPKAIQNKIDAGIIKGAHLSDLLRLELLVRYGGTWIDSTVFCSGDNIPDYMMNSELFMFQCLKPGLDGHSTAVSNWFISARSNNKLLFCVRELLYDYWNRNNTLMDYYIFHMFFQICIERYPDEWKKVVPFSNSVPHILLLRCDEQFDERVYKALCEMTPFHKLSYRTIKEGVENKKGTYYSRIME